MEVLNEINTFYEKYSIEDPWEKAIFSKIKKNGK